jgi:protein subunit release factor A
VSQLLRLLELQGWLVEVRPAIGGEVMVIAAKDCYEVARQGATVADVAVEVFKEVAHVSGRHEPVQLELV